MRENARIYRKLFLKEDETIVDELEEDKYGSPPIKQWNLKIVGIISLSSMLFSIPWLIINLSGLHKSQRVLEHALPLSIYALSFYAVASMCVYMRYRDYKYGNHVFVDSMDCCVEPIQKPCATIPKSTNISNQDLLSNMEGEESYGTFGL